MIEFSASITNKSVSELGRVVRCPAGEGPGKTAALVVACEITPLTERIHRVSVLIPSFITDAASHTNVTSLLQLLLLLQLDFISTDSAVRVHHVQCD